MIVRRPSSSTIRGKAVSLCLSFSRKIGTIIRIILVVEIIGTIWNIKTQLTKLLL